jgi:hypothetical protein
MPVMRNTALHYRPPVHMVELTTAALAARQVPAKKRVDPPMVRQIGRILQKTGDRCAFEDWAALSEG